TSREYLVIREAPNSFFSSEVQFIRSLSKTGSIMEHEPPSVPPGLSSGPNNTSTSHLDLYFGGEVFHSPHTSDSTSGSGSDSSDSNDSEATLEDTEVFQFGHPLQRMFRVGSSDDDSQSFSESLSRSSTSSFASNSSWSSTSSVTYDMCERPLQLE
ncbi:hypothetical protein H0H81_000462, partial [Sphagnurus paluster]